MLCGGGLVSLNAGSISQARSSSKMEILAYLQSENFHIGATISGNYHFGGENTTTSLLLVTYFNPTTVGNYGTDNPSSASFSSSGLCEVIWVSQSLAPHL